MKKLMIVAAVAFAAIASQAAAFTWSTTNKMTDSKGNVLGSAADYTTALNGGNIVLVLLSTGSYDGAMTILNGQTAPTLKTSPASKKGQVSASFSFTYDETEGATNILKDGDILGVMFKDSDGNLSQLVYSSDMATKVNDTYTVTGLEASGNRWSGTGFTFATGGNFTTAAVPEPTSGLLLLLGVAGLTLRRRHA